jgi:hypothetical protein
LALCQHIAGLSKAPTKGLPFCRETDEPRDDEPRDEETADDRDESGA